MQVQALRVKLDAGRTPGLDFGVWGPFGRKLLRAMKFRNWINNGDGTYVTKELPGPENYMQWKAIFIVFMTAAIMLDRIMEHAMEKYRKRIEKLITLWPECWHLIYTADEKMRMEHMERIRRKVVRDMAGGTAAPPHWDGRARRTRRSNAWGSRVRRSCFHAVRPLRCRWRSTSDRAGRQPPTTTHRPST